MNGCKFRTPGKQMQIKGPECTLDISGQNGIGHLVSKSIEGGVVTTEMTLSGVTTTQTGAGCPDGNNHQAANLSITTNLLLKAFSFTFSQELVKHGHQYLEHVIGGQVSIAST